MARCCSVSVFLVVVLLVTSSLAASTKRRQATRRKAPAKPIVQHYYPPIHGPYRTSASVPAKSASGKPNTNTRQIQQWQIAVNVPPGSALPPQGNAPPNPAAPGHIWIQVPVSGYPQAPAPNPVPVSQLPSEEPTAPEEVAPEQPAPQEPAPGQPDLGQPAPEEPALLQPQEPTGEEETSENEVGSSLSQPPSTAGDIGTDPEKLKHCLEPRGQFPSPTECNKFYNCWDGYVAEQSCPGELVFSDEGPYCDYVDNVDCSQRGGVPPPPPPPAAQPPQQEQGEEGFAPGSEDGSDHEGEEVGGQEEEQVQISEEELAEDVGEGCKEPYSRYRSPKNCGVFIVCDNGNPIRFMCPATLNYNEGLGICDYAYRVDCGASTPAAQSPEPAPSEEAEPAPQVPEEVLRYYGGFAKMPPLPLGYGQRKRQRQG